MQHANLRLRLGPHGPVARHLVPALRPGLALATVAVLATACAGSGGGSSSNASASSGASGSAAAVTTLRAAIPTTGTMLPVWIAQQQGIFTKHGLDVQTSPVSDISQVPPTLGKQYDLTLSTAPNVIQAQLGHLDIVAVSANTINERSPQDVQVIASPQSGITSLKGLEGRTVGVQSLVGNVQFAAEYMMIKAGVNVSTIKFVQIPPNNMADQLEAGRADAVEAGTPALGAIEKAGGVALGDPFLSLPKVPNLSSLWIANADWAKKNAKAISAWRASIAEAADYIKSHLDAAYQVEAAKTGQAVDLVRASSLPNFATDISASDFQVWIDAMKAVGAITSAPTAKSLVAGA